MKKLNKKGFTLIELIVVIAILAILAAILIPAITGYITKATDGKNQANCRAYYSQVSLQVMLDQTLSPATATTVNNLLVEYTVDSTNKVVTAFACTPNTGTTTKLTLK
ncbi:MAG: prepilin-type N-terminal cleavage/methylation [Erysipelotrichaceae bacterium]|nr:MAG: prepilin-type N-terminal cleavage/methylation [Erysipelotrichaceae bacterium]